MRSPTTQRFERLGAGGGADAELLEYRPSQRDAREPRGTLPAIDIATTEERRQ